MEKFTTAFRGAKIQLKRTHVSELNISRFTTYIRKASLMYVVNLEITITARLMSELYYKMCNMITGIYFGPVFVH